MIDYDREAASGVAAPPSRRGPLGAGPGRGRPRPETRRPRDHDRRQGAAYFAAPSDLAETTAAWRVRTDATDRFERVASLLGMQPVGEATFPGVGQARSPCQWRDLVRAGRVSWAGDGVDRALAGLPDQDRARPEPVYRITAFS